MLDRTWYNTLVDDDGSGVVGSVWDKADVDSLMDAIDAEIARLDARHASGVWIPTLSGSGGGTPTYAFQQGTYSQSGDTVQLSGRITLSSKGSLVGVLSILGSGYVGASNASQALAIGYFAGMASPGLFPSAIINPGSSALGLYVASSSNPLSVALDVSYIDNGFDLIFGGAFKKG
jgi:hypothetical protein